MFFQTEKNLKNLGNTMESVIKLTDGKDEGEIVDIIRVAHLLYMTYFLFNWGVEAVDRQRASIEDVTETKNRWIFKPIAGIDT